MKEIAAERVELVRNSIAPADVQPQIAKHIVMEAKKGFCFGTRALIPAVCERLRDGNEPVRDTLHRGDDHDDPRCCCYGPDETGGVEHALGA